MEKIIIESERLIIKSRTIEEMQVVRDNEKDEEMIQAYGEMIDNMKTLGNKDYWGCDWLISLKDGTPIGGIGFKGLPDKDGKIEVGYGIDLEYRKNGYATEAVKAMINWSKTQDGVKWFQAQTLEDNLISQKVLLNNGLVRNGFGDEGPLFEIKIK